MAFILSLLNAYLTGCFLFSSELRELQNYPIFLLTTIDFLVTSLGYLGKFFSRNFIIYHPSNVASLFVSDGFNFFNKIRYSLQQIFQQWTTENIHPFWFGCLPSLAMIRINEYGFGLCSLLLAYERYVLICKPTEKTILLSSERRKKLYTVTTLIILMSVMVDAVHSYIRQKWSCDLIFTVSNNAGLTVTTLTSLFLSAVYSFIPAVFCFLMYWDIGLVLLNRDKKIGRNLNLVLCFATICCVWLLCLFARSAWIIYLWILYTTVHPNLKKFRYPLMTNPDKRDLIYQCSAISSLLDPFLILLCQKDYRTPFKNQLEKIRNLCRLNSR